ncbi:hypothetical protein Q3Y64_04780 [Uliginosibacterium sp. 31-12]|nr:hypothetical protein [Uliginosibacterium sp. 31-12]
MNLCDETGKICYDSHAQAEQQIIVIRRRPGYKPMKAYQCKFCSGWHLTSCRTPTTAQQKNRRAVKGMR